MTTEKAEPDILLACPFCGSKPMITDGELWEISCESCDCAAAVVTRGGKFLEAAKAWNTRAAPARCDAQSEAEPVAWRFKHCGKWVLVPWIPAVKHEPLYTAAAQQVVREATIEECAKVCDLHAKWASDKIREDEGPESTHNQLFATIGNTASACADLIRALSKTEPAQETFKPCVIYTEEIQLTEMILEDTLIVWQPWGPFKGHAVDCGYSTDGRLVGIQIWDDVRTKRPAETKPAQDSKLATLVLEYARDLRRNSSGGDDYPWEYAKATADYLEELVRRSETKPARGDAVADHVAVNWLLDKSRELNERQRWYLAESIANEIEHHLEGDAEPVEGYARSILRDIISIAKDAHATDALEDIVKRAEEGLGND